MVCIILNSIVSMLNFLSMTIFVRLCKNTFVSSRCMVRGIMLTVIMKPTKNTYTHINKRHERERRKKIWQHIKN